MPGIRSRQILIMSVPNAFKVCVRNRSRLSMFLASISKLENSSEQTSGRLRDPGNRLSSVLLLTFQAFGVVTRICRSGMLLRKLQTTPYSLQLRQ